VEIKIDTDRMKDGKTVADRLRRGRTGGIPWIVILDGSGKELVSSDGPSGNIGAPVKPLEVAWFMIMVDRSRQHMSEEQFHGLCRDLESYAETIRSR
jgi:hypothetical protein